ncbi:P-loop containing nucleoside triphosphate hydrolase protein [Trametes polyzona]|nr:P-loop containing nucleoside triphosphate hydrolase protein [Trametes polyzona]
MSMPPSRTSPAADLPDIPEIRRRTEERFGRRPCLWQCETALAILQGNRDIVCISSTGSGKTLTFWMPLLFRPQGVQVVITPLNILGVQNKNQLHAVGIPAIVISGETATHDNFKRAGSLSHGVVVLNPENAFKNPLAFDWLWENTALTSRLISIIWDEAHCIKAWGSFRPSIKESGRLRNLLSSSIPYVMPSATFPDHVCNEVLDIVQARKDHVRYIRRSNDRPNVFLTVRKIQHAVSSYEDLNFLIPDNWTPETDIPPFLIFFDNIEDSINATEALRRRLPPEHAGRIVWFNSDNTPGFRERSTEGFREHKLLGLSCTDSFGMGMDVAKVKVVIQWRMTCDMDSLWQRWGHAARAFGTRALAILFVESKYFDDEKEQAAARAQKRQAAVASKAARKEANKRKRAGTVESQADAYPRRPEQKKTCTGESALAVPGVAESLPDSIARGMRPGAALGTWADSSPTAGSAAHSGGPVLELTEYEHLQVSYAQSHAVQRVENGGGKGGRKAGKDTTCQTLTPELDNLINAASRSIKCYRKPITAFYENDRIVPDMQVCCGRCFVPPPSSPPCCSLCTPDYDLLAILPNPAASPIKPSIPRASKVSTKHDMSADDLTLQRALNTFRRDKTTAKYGPQHLRNLGPALIMSNDVLKRIADCARARKLTCVEDLLRETKWNKASEFGEEVLRVVTRLRKTRFRATQVQRVWRHRTHQ